VAVTSAGPYANHLHLAPDRSPHQYLTSVFTGWMTFLPPNQQHQGTEGTLLPKVLIWKKGQEENQSETG